MHLLCAVLVGMLGFPSSSLQGGPLPIRLIGVVVNQSSPDKSVCLLAPSSSTGSPLMARAGDRVFDVAIVQAIDAANVLLKNLATNGIEILTLGESAAPAVKPGPAPAPPAPVVREAPPERERIVPKSVVDHYRANLKEVLESATAAPRIRTLEGRSVIDGFEIRSVKSGSIVEQLGFRVGDVVLEVNGTRLDGLDKVMNAYQNLRDATRVDLTVLREGKTRTIAFSQK